MIPISDVLEAVSGQAIGLDPKQIVVGIAPIQNPKPHYIIPYFSDVYQDQLACLPKTAVVVSTPAMNVPQTVPHILVSDGPAAMAQGIRLFEASISGLPTLIHETARVHASAYIGEGAVIQAHAVIEAGVVVGDRSVVGMHAHIFPNTTVGDSVRIGHRCVIRSGAVIGSHGFGYQTQSDRTHQLMPHQGGVWLGESVHVGSLTTIDRGVLSDTRVGTGTKIDAHCHIAHNAWIGEHCLMAGGVQFAGSVTIGDHCIFAGQVAVRDHVTIGPNSVILSRAGVTKSFPSGGVTLFGFPAQLHRDELRFQAKIKRMVNTK